MAGYDANIGGEVLFERRDLRGFAGSLTADDSTDFGGYVQVLVRGPLDGRRNHTWPKRLHNGINILRLDTIDDVIAAPRDKMAASHNFNFWLELSQHASIIDVHRLSYTVLKLFDQCVELLGDIAGVNPSWHVSRSSSVGIG